VDIDFYFCKTPRNMAKLKALARALNAIILQPWYPVSSLYRLQRETDGLQIDFMGRIDGIRSWEGVRKRATAFPMGRGSIWVAALSDVIRSKRAARRPKDVAVIELLEKTLAEQENLS
jgi:hypothetical protein